MGRALLMARAMTSRIGSATSDRSHWASRALALLAPLLHGAAVHGRDMEVVVDWVMRHEIDEAGFCWRTSAAQDWRSGACSGC